MLRRSPLWLLAAAAAAVAAFSFFPQYRLVSPMDQAALPQAAAYLIVFGAGDKQPAAWDGSIRLSGGQILNEAAERRTLARDTIWQGNCDAADQPCRSNIASLRITFPIEYRMSNCPAKFGAASFERRLICFLRLISTSG